MQVELKIAIEDGRPLAFAAGCLLAAWRELPARREGRFLLASHAFALGLVLPAAALSLSGALLGYPYLAVGQAGFRGFLAGSSEQLPLLNAGDWAIAPPLTLLVLVLAGSQLALAWFLLERDWLRVFAIGRFNAAALTTLILVTGVLAFGLAPMLVPIGLLVTETLALLVLAQWHDELPAGVWLDEAGG